MEKTSWTNCVRNEEVLHGVQEYMNILYAIKLRKTNWIGHIWLLNHVIDAKISVMRKRRKRRKQLLDGFKKKRRYCKLKEKALEPTLWRTRFGSCYGPVVRQTTE
jgi:hypothetical protein